MAFNKQPLDVDPKQIDRVAALMKENGLLKTDLDIAGPVFRAARWPPPRTGKAAPRDQLMALLGRNTGCQRGLYGTIVVPCG